MNRSIKKSYIPYILAQIIFDGLGVLCLAYIPLIEKNLFDFGLQHGFSYILWLILLVFVLHLFYMITQYICILCGFYSGILFENGLKQRLVDRLFHWSWKQFHQRQVEQYLSLLNNDVLALEQDDLQPFVDLLRSLVNIIIYAVVLFLAIDIRIGITIFLLSILAISLPRLIGRKLEQARHTYQESLGKYMIFISDLFHAFSLKDQKTTSTLLNTHEQNLQHIAHLRLGYGKQKAFVLSLSLFFTKLIKVGTFALTGYLYFKQEITAGTGIAVFSYIYSFLDPVDNILYDFTTIQSMRKVKQKVKQIINTPLSDLQPPKTSFSKITCNHVSYQQGDFELQDIQLTIISGQKIAIIGDSGSGKSTFLHLLAHHIDPTVGQIYIDEQPIQTINLEEILYFQSQNSPIFHASANQNITIYQAYPPYNDQHLYPTLLDPHKIDATIFSGGEKQYMSLLRGLSKNSNLWLLDEPFSALDETKRNHLTKFLCQDPQMQDKTVIMVTHDHQQLSLFDQVIVFDHGKIQSIIQKNNLS